MASGAAKSNRTRARLHYKQDGRCFYCPSPVGIYTRDLNNPVLEHYIPRSAGGRRVVLACNSCDKMKGMIPGPEFEEMLRTNTLEDDSPNQVRQKIAAACKARNKELQEKHEPCRPGRERTLMRTAMIAAVKNVSMTEYPQPSQAAIGTAGKDAFIEQWNGARYMNEKEKPHTGDRHYEGWTGKRPA